MYLSMALLQSTQLTSWDTILHRVAEGVGETTLGTMGGETIVGCISGAWHCAGRSKGTIKILVKGSSADSKEKFRAISLQIAAETGHGAIIKAFIVAGASPYVCAEYRGGKG